MKYLQLFENYISETSHFIYHGTNKKFTSFDLNKVGKGYGMSYWGYGIYFSGIKEEAIKYAKWVVEKNGGNPYLYTIDIKGLNFYELDYDNSIKLSSEEIEHMLSELKEVLNPEIIKFVRVFHPEYDWRNDEDNRYVDYIYDGSNGDIVIEKYIDKLRNNFYHKEHSYSANSFYSEILPDYFNKVEKGQGDKLTALFIKKCGYDGITFIDDVNKKGYVIFNPEKISSLSVEKLN